MVCFLTAMMIHVFCTFVWYDNKLTWLFDLNYIIIPLLIINSNKAFPTTIFLSWITHKNFTVHMTQVGPHHACVGPILTLTTIKFAEIQHTVRHLDPWGTISMHDLPISYCLCSLEVRKQCLYGKHWIVYGMQTLFFIDHRTWEPAVCQIHSFIMFSWFTANDT